MTTPLPYAHVIFDNLETGDHYGDYDAVMVSNRWGLGSVDRPAFTVNGDIAKTIFDAAGIYGNVQASLYVGNKLIGKKLVQHPLYDIAQPGTLTDDGPSVLDAYEGVPVRRQTNYNDTVLDVVDQLFKHHPGIPGIWDPTQLVASYALEPKAFGLKVTEDLHDLGVLKAVETLAHDIGAQIGVDYGQWWGDSSDMTIHISKLGLAPVLTFGDGGGGVKEILRRTTLDVDWQETYSRLVISGGGSDHGLPQGYQITGLAGVAGAAGVVDSTFVAGVWAGDTLGGVFFLTPDLVWHPLSQNMGVACLFYDPLRTIFYAGTKRGLYERNAHSGVGIWKLTGRFAGSVKDVFVDTQSVRSDPAGQLESGAQVYIVSDEAQPGLAGLFAYPCPTEADATRTIGTGHDYWYMVIGGDVICASAINNVIYYVLSADPTKIRRLKGVYGGAAKTTDTFLTPGKYSITKMVRLDSGVYVITDGGTDGLYFIASGTNRAVLDNHGLPGSVVNNIVQGVDDRLYALTNSGPYYKNGSGKWVPVSAVGGLVGTSVSQFAVGYLSPADQGLYTPNTPPGSEVMLAAGGPSVFYSRTVGAYWTDINAERVGVATWLRTKGIATASDADFIWVVGIDGQNMPTYELVKRRAPFTPGAQCSFSDVVEITADENTSVDRASEAVGRVGLRFLRHASTPIGGAQAVESHFEDENDLLMDLRPGMKVTLFYHDAACGPWPAVTYTATHFVIDHEVQVDENGGHAKTTLGHSTAIKRYTAEELGRDILFTMSRLVRS